MRTTVFIWKENTKHLLFYTLMSMCICLFSLVAWWILLRNRRSGAVFRSSIEIFSVYISHWMGSRNSSDLLGAIKWYIDIYVVIFKMKFRRKSMANIEKCSEQFKATAVIKCYVRALSYMTMRFRLLAHHFTPISSILYFILFLVLRFYSPIFCGLNIETNIAIIFAAMNQNAQNPRWTDEKNQMCAYIGYCSELYLCIWPSALRVIKCTIIQRSLHIAHTRQCKQQHVYFEGWIFSMRLEQLRYVQSFFIHFCLIEV